VFRIILTQGLNRQIRRMCEAFGYEVVALQRVRIMRIRLGELPLGRWRNLTAAEVATLSVRRPSPPAPPPTTSAPRRGGSPRGPQGRPRDRGRRPW
jgi:hypothetical protein